MAVLQAPKSAADDRTLQLTLRRARRTWRRAGVRATDRQRLTEELHGELAGAADAGQPPSIVLGADPRETLLQWAHEQGVSGQAQRIGLLAPLTMLGVLFGSLVLVTDQVVERLVPGAPFITNGAIWLAVLISSIVVSWLLAPLCCWAALHRGGDPKAASTARWLFALLPPAALCALALDVMIAAITATEGPFISIMAVFTAASFAGAAVAARHLATRYNRQPDQNRSQEAARV